jgi:hypothetical protein
MKKLRLIVSISLIVTLFLSITTVSSFASSNVKDTYTKAVNEIDTCHVYNFVVNGEVIPATLYKYNSGNPYSYDSKYDYVGGESEDWILKIGGKQTPNNASYLISNSVRERYWDTKIIPKYSIIVTYKGSNSNVFIEPLDIKLLIDDMDYTDIDDYKTLQVIESWTVQCNVITDLTIDNKSIKSVNIANNNFTNKYNEVGNITITKNCKKLNKLTLSDRINTVNVHVLNKVTKLIYSAPLSSVTNGKKITTAKKLSKKNVSKNVWNGWLKYIKPIKKNGLYVYNCSSKNITKAQWASRKANKKAGK